jgi:negative regulator of sigma E activity
MESPTARHSRHVGQSVAVRAGCAILFGLFIASAAIIAQSVADASLIAQVDRAENHRETGLPGYTVEEHYSITNSHFKEPALAVVKVVYTRDAGKQYDVISRSGPGLLASTLLNSMLAEEQKLSRNPTRSQAVITSANYSMTPLTEVAVNGRDCAVLAITPRQRTAYVMKGRIWVDATSRLIVRIDGVTAQSPSFFAAKPSIQRDYAEIGGFALAFHSHAVSSSFFAGKTVVDIDYVHYQLTPGQ